MLLYFHYHIHFTAQNTKGVTNILEVDEKFLADQLDTIFTDIYPDSIKIGMVANPKLIKVIKEKLIAYKANNIVVDPVMVATSGANLTSNQAIIALEQLLFPIASLIIPNIIEAQIISGKTIETMQDMEEAAKIIYEKYQCPTLIKGGHSINDANDYLYSKDLKQWFYSNRIDNPNTHGTGCTLSSAIASNLAKGYSLDKAIYNAKDYLTNALESNLNLGQGSGPLDHGFALKSPFI